MATGGIQLIDTFKYSGKKYLDLRQHCDTLEELKATSEQSIPDGFTKYCEETKCWYEYNSQNEEWDDTGRWRKTSPISEMLSSDYIFAIVDNEGNLLFGIRYDGEVVYSKGMGDEVRIRLDELNGIRKMDDENYIYAITDAEGNLLFGIRNNGEVVYDKGIPEEVRKRLEELNGYKLMSDENYLFAITDLNDHLLFGIKHNGEIVYDKGIPGEVKTRLDELKGIRAMHDENYLFALTDRLNNILIGIKHNGEVVMPKGVVRVTTWEKYNNEPHTPDTLYIIQGDKGRIDGAFINGRAVTAGEEFAFMRKANLLVYHGAMSVLPKIWIDHEEMQLMIEYPSNYSGPLFVVEDGMLFLI